MRTSKHRCFLGKNLCAALLALFLSTCGDNGGTDEDTSLDVPEAVPEQDSQYDVPVDVPVESTGGWTLEQFCTAYENRFSGWWDWYDTCCTEEDRASDEFDAFALYAIYEVDVAGCMSDFQDKIDAGTIRFDGTRAEECVAALEADLVPAPVGCSGIPTADIVLNNHGGVSFAQIPACRATMAGQIQENQPCDFEYECVEGLRCRNISGDWICSQTGALGSSCSLDSECEEGLLCVGRVGEGTCGPLSGAYGPCGFSYHCQNGLMCDYGTNTCYVPTEQGGSCGTGLPDCIPGTYCEFVNDRCVLYPAAGEYCMFALTCAGRCDTAAEVCVSMCGSP